WCWIRRHAPHGAAPRPLRLPSTPPRPASGRTPHGGNSPTESAMEQIPGIAALYTQSFRGYGAGVSSSLPEIRSNRAYNATSTLNPLEGSATLDVTKQAAPGPVGGTGTALRGAGRTKSWAARQRRYPMGSQVEDLKCERCGSSKVIPRVPLWDHVGYASE